MNISWEILKHEELTTCCKNQIAVIKDQHWKHGMKSQLDWMDKNICYGDLHLVGKLQNDKNERICAYLNLVHINASFDGNENECIGVGNVCVDKEYEHIGYGSLLLNQANEYLLKLGKQGILLCKDALVPFYEKCNWEKIFSKQVRIRSKDYIDNVMSFPIVKQHIDEIKLDRNF